MGTEAADITKAEWDELGAAIREDERARLRDAVEGLKAVQRREGYMETPMDALDAVLRALLAEPTQ